MLSLFRIPFFFAAPTSSPTSGAATQHAIAQFVQSHRWQVAAWSVALLFFLIWGIALWSFWKKRDIRGNNPFFLIFREAFTQFRAPLLLLSLGATWIIASGFIAGAQISMILFVGLTTVTVALLSIMAWKMWPRNNPEGNLFDLLPLPQVQWPHYENEQDRLARVWVQERVRQTKALPPKFRGERFGMIVLEVAEELAQIYKKPNILSVQTEALLQGLERTAADMKILCNHLPLADRLTLAEFEKEIQEAVKEGKRLYLFLLLVLSIVNPGNLLRVFLLLFQARSPWEHVLHDLEAWVYANYTERLGYHMALIYSGRKPPPIEDLEASIKKAESERDREARNQKLGTLAFLSLFGSALYLVVQFTSATIFFGSNYVMLSIPFLGALGYSAWQLRSPKRWRDFWDALRPSWPLEKPALTAKDQRALDQADLVLLKKVSVPIVKNLDDTKKLPAHYGRIVWDLWEACFSAYRNPNDPNAMRATRAFYLPQGFAGIEALAHDLRRWYKSETFFARGLRALESLGWDLGFLYQILERRSQETEPAPPPLSPLATEASVIHEKSAQDSKKPVKAENTEPTGSSEKGDFFSSLLKGVKAVGRAVTDYAKDIAINEAHQHFVRLLRADLVLRLVDIYGARFPASTFAQDPRTQKALPLAKIEADKPVIDAIEVPSETEEAPTSEQAETSTGSETPAQTEAPTNEKATETTTPSEKKTASETTDKPSAAQDATSESPESSSAKDLPKETLASSVPSTSTPSEKSTAPSAKAEPSQKETPVTEEKTPKETHSEAPSPASEKTEKPKPPAAAPPSQLATNEEGADSKRLLLLTRDPRFAEIFLKTYFKQPTEASLTFEQRTPIRLFHQTTEKAEVAIYGACWDVEESSPKADLELFSTRAYHHVVVLEEIDYGARGHVARKIREDLFDAMRLGNLGPLLLVLLGVEKLKPLSWNPPYDDYKMQEPSQKKSQRIRQALLAWREAFASFHSIPMDSIFPLGAPSEGRPWGLDPLYKHLQIYPKDT
ncbi:MAG: hypothetical protein H6728_07315 [Myxococcales bacterium]|nr:hypothetical protein [Myxococcales bacterium]